MPVKLIKIANVSGVSWVFLNRSMFHPVAAFIRIGPWFLIWTRKLGSDVQLGLSSHAMLSICTPIPPEPQTSPLSVKQTKDLIEQKISRALQHARTSIPYSQKFVKRARTGRKSKAQ